MAAHTVHPDTHTNGLADFCGRCKEHAQDPFAGLDAGNLLLLVDRTLSRMRDDPDALPRSENEALAMRNMETAINHARALTRIGVEL